MNTHKIITIVVAIVAIVIGINIGYEMREPETQVVKVCETPSLDEWSIMKLAIIKTESEFDSLAVGRCEDWGLYQITPVYVDEVNRILGEERYTHDDAFNPIKADAMFETMQSRHNPTRDIDKAIASHNPTASDAYAIKVRRNMEWIRMYERVRETAR